MLYLIPRIPNFYLAILKTDPFLVDFEGLVGSRGLRRIKILTITKNSFNFILVEVLSIKKTQIFTLDFYPPGPGALRVRRIKKWPAPDFRGGCFSEKMLKFQNFGSPQVSLAFLPHFLRPQAKTQNSALSIFLPLTPCSKNVYTTHRLKTLRWDRFGRKPTFCVQARPRGPQGPNHPTGGKVSLCQISALGVERWGCIYWAYKHTHPFEALP